MQRFFKQTVRQYVQEARGLNELRKKLNTRYTREQIQEGILECLTYDQKKATLSSIGEFFIENNVFYTEKQIMEFIQANFFGLSSEVPVDKLAAFFIIADQERSIQPNKTPSQKQLFLKLDLFQMLNQAVKSSQQLKQMKQQFRTKYRIADLFRQVRKQYEDYADAQTIAKYCGLDIAYGQAFMAILGMQRINIQQIHDFFEEDQPEVQSEELKVEISPPKRIDILVQERFLVQYLSKIVEFIVEIQTAKEDLITEFSDLSVEACFLMFSSSLNKSLNLKKFQQKCQQFGVLQTQKAFYLFIRKYGQEGKIDLGGFRRFFGPTHESFKQILSRRQLKPLSQKSMTKFLRILSEALKGQCQLQERKFRQTDYGRLFMKIDRNKDTFLCQSDLKLVLKDYEKKYIGRHLAIIINRFTQNTASNKISYQHFVEQMQPKII